MRFSIKVALLKREQQEVVFANISRILSDKLSNKIEILDTRTMGNWQFWSKLKLGGSSAACDLMAQRKSFGLYGDSALYLKSGSNKNSFRGDLFEALQEIATGDTILDDINENMVFKPIAEATISTIAATIEEGPVRCNGWSAPDYPSDSQNYPVKSWIKFAHTPYPLLSGTPSWKNQLRSDS